MYDVFISFKNRDKNDNLTEDTKIAEKLYAELKNRRIEVFFSNHEIEEQGESQWRKSIDKALEEANTLVLIGTSLENINSPQVVYEWEQIFMEEIISRKKPDGRIIGYFDGIDRGACPQKLQNQELFEVENKSIGELCDFIERRLPHRGTGEIITQPDSEKKYNKRFHYAAGYTSLVGRENEIDFLRQFCVENNALLAWTVISGQGGLGKSRLAYEFCGIIEREGWKTFRPSHAKSFIKDNLLKIASDAVICFDYVKFELEYVEEILQFVVDQKIRHKIRIILIERDGASVENGFSSKIEEYHYKADDIRLEPIEDNALVELIQSYIRNIGKLEALTDRDIVNMIDTLKEVDPGVCRPLFAMFIADAWVDGSINLQDWDRDSAVKYIANKELDRFDTIISNYSNTTSEKKQFREALYAAVAYATFAGELNVADMLIERDMNIAITDQILKQMLEDGELIKDDTVKGVEPDLVGEYICISILDRLKKENVSAFFSKLYENRFMDMIAYFDKIYDDYTDVFLNSFWSEYATIIELPITFNYVRNNMFNGCGFIHEVKLHEGITAISKGAFRDCDHLTKINFPDNLEIIDSAAFVNCVALELAVPDDEKGWAPSIIYIGDRAFKNCKKLKEIRIPRSVKEIGTEAFAKCTALESVEIPKDVLVISHNMFEACSSLRHVELKENNREIVIQSEAFKRCTNLASIKYSRRISIIGKSAFEKCENLKKISLGDKLTDILDSAFKGCISLEEIDLSTTSLRRINRSVFEGCKNIERVILPSTLSFIAARGFGGCCKLNHIYLPDSINRIGEFAFYGCQVLDMDSFGQNVGKIRDFCAFSVKSIDNDLIKFVTSYYDEKDIVLPRNIYRIGDRAFLNDRNIETIEFHDGITGLGKEAFRGCSGLKKVNGSFAGIKSIGEGAFWGCKELECIPTISVINEVADSTFRYCMSLKAIKINSELQKIGKLAFFQCSSLQKLSFKGGCSYISAGAFSGCERFHLSDKYHIKKRGRQFYICGFIFSRISRDEMYFINNYTEWENVRIPTSCVGFYENPFEHTKAKKIYVPNSVKSLIKNNFSNTQNVESIRLPRHISFIPDGTFEGCASLKRVEMPETSNNSFKEGVRIGKRAFAGCASLEYIGLPSDTVKLDNAIFQNCKSLREINFNKELKIIGDAVFSGCDALISILLPASLEQMGYAVFKDCVSLETVTGLENTKIVTLQNETFKGCINLTEVKLPAQIQSIGPFVFNDCRSLEKIDLFRTDISYIGIAAFQNCYNLKECALPRKVKKIEKFTFKSCTQLKSIKMAPDIEEIGTSAFFGCNMLNEIDLHNKRNLKQLGNDAFAGCHRLEKMIIPAGIEKLSRGLFRGCVSIETMELLGNVKKIPVDCFKDCKKLRTLSINSEITSVGAGAFRNCFAFNDIFFLSNVAKVEVAAFRGCVGLEKAELRCIEEIPSALFMGCSNLVMVDFPRVQNLDNYAFYRCKELVDVPIKRALTRIGDGAFWGCRKLKKLEFSETMFDIQPSAFRDCESVEDVRFPLGINRIYAASFRGAKNLTSILIPETAREIHKSTFRECERLEVVDIESDYITIESTAFGGCEELYYFNFHGLVEAQQTAFEGTPIESDLHNDDRVQWVE